MALIPIEHPHRLASPVEAEAWFRALGEKRVSVRGFHTTEPTRFQRLVGAIEPRHDHTISFEDGALSAAAWEALDALATSRFGYLDICTTDANLRIWPERYSWVHASRDPARAARALGVPLKEGTTTMGDTEVTIKEHHPGYWLKVETKTITTALKLFRELAGERIDRGFINGVHADTKPALVRFLSEASTRVNAVIELKLAAARELTELYAGEKLDWQTYPVLVDFPDGRIHGFLTTPKTDERHRNKWLVRVTKALRRAGLE